MVADFFNVFEFGFVGAGGFYFGGVGDFREIAEEVGEGVIRFG